MNRALYGAIASNPNADSIALAEGIYLCKKIRSRRNAGHDLDLNNLKFFLSVPAESFLWSCINFRRLNSWIRKNYLEIY